MGDLVLKNNFEKKKKKKKKINPSRPDPGINFYFNTTFWNERSGKG